jgi:hypothetical protein
MCTFREGSLANAGTRLLDAMVPAALTLSAMIASNFKLLIVAARARPRRRRLWQLPWHPVLLQAVVACV